MNSKKKCFKIALFVIAFLNFNSILFAQDSECKDKVVAFQEFAKTNNFDESTYQPWLDLKKKCAKFDESIYLIGETILKQKIYKANASEAKNIIVNELASLYDEHDKNFPNNNKGNKLNKALLFYENKVGTDDEIYAFLDKSFKTEYAQFTSPTALDLYSELLSKQFKSGDKGITADQVFEKLDLIAEKVQIEVASISKVVDALTLKQKTEVLTSEEKRTLDNSKVSLDQLNIVSSNLDGRINEIANCESLTSFYDKNFEKNKDNAFWLERAADRLNSKKCKSELYTKISEQFHKVNPSSKSAYNMAVISRSAKNNKQATEYFAQAADLQTDANKKAEYYYTLATTYGYSNKAKAREAALKAIELKPSMGKAHTYIAQLYANSINDCGENNFDSKAVYWLAAESAKKAGVVEPKFKKSADDLAESFMKKAPSKKDVSDAKRKSGQQISIKCWINECVVIPKM
ncbi:tetratricopeptide repeat protein [Flavobacterium qiangtangense]|uniref:Tetratricopeptide repeat protein n=1 Tax=Flavobacterium qiangtangense TaxID=1442595 RepID=A0ABW1PN79_9FLAO